MWHINSFTYKSVWAFILSGLLSSSGASSQTVKSFTQSAWPDTVFYLARLGNTLGLDSGYGDVTVEVRSGNDYSLYIDGVFIGGKNSSDYLEKFPVTLPAATADFAVAINNDGLGKGYDFMLGINSHSMNKSEWLGTSIEQRRSETVGDSLRLFPVRWYCFTGSEQELNYLAHGVWYIDGPGRLSDPEFTSRLQPVSKGHLPLDIMPIEHSDVITGYRDNVDTTVDGGGITLRRIDGENLAFGRISEQPSLTDGNTFRGVKFEHNPILEAPHGYSVDLGNPYRVNRVVLYTGGENLQNWPMEAVLGYRVEVSFDNINWDEVGVIHDIGVNNEGGFDHYEVTFPPEWARYVRFQISETREEYPNVGEMMVYGVGYAYEGSYESDWQDFNDPAALKYFLSAAREGTGDGITIQIKTNAPTFNQFAPVDWSEPISCTEFSLEQFIPAPALQYRINFTLQNNQTAPALSSITFRYSTEDPTSAEAASPMQTMIFPPHPNPFNPSTSIEYRIAEPGHVVLDIYNAFGQKIATLVDGYYEAGAHTAMFDGAGISSGLYFYRFRARNFEKTGRMMLVK